MLFPPQSLQVLLCRLCSQMLVPPQSLQLLLSRLCWQMLVPPQSLHLLLWRLCWQMLAPPQSLHWLLRRLCSHFFSTRRAATPDSGREPVCVDEVAGAGAVALAVLRGVVV